MYDENQLVVSRNHRNKRISSQDPITVSTVTVRKKTKFQQNVVKTLEELGVFRLNNFSSTASIPMNCSVASKLTDCVVASARTTLNYNVDSPSVFLTSWNATLKKKCHHTKPSLTSNQLNTVQTQNIIFAITPTYARYTQKVDLTALCHTVSLVQNIVWIVVEDSDSKTSLVSNLLERCKSTSVHLNVRTPAAYRPRPGADRYKVMYSRGVKQRNLGLSWIREHCSIVKNCTGVVYFMDDDNKYDLRLFEEVSMIIISYSYKLFNYVSTCTYVEIKLCSFTTELDYQEMYLVHVSIGEKVIDLCR